MGVEEVTISLRPMSGDLDDIKSCLRSTHEVTLDRWPEPRATVCRSGGIGVCVLVGWGGGFDCKYAVCHPASSDEWYLRLVVDLAIAFGSELILRESQQSRTHYIASDPDFILDAGRAIALKRAYWHTAFGAEEAAVTPEDAIDRFIVHRKG